MYTHNLFDLCLVDINTKVESHLSQMDFNKEFRTWQVSTPRRSGKTSWILRQIRPRDIVIAPSWAIASLYYKHHKLTWTIEGLKPSNWWRTEELINKGLTWEEVCSRRVFLDEIEICPEVYQIKAERYISLGTFS